METQLRNLERRLDEALAAARIVFWDWEPDSDELVMSSSVSDVLGLEPGRTITRSAETLELIHPDDRDTYRAEVRAALRAGTSWRSEFRVLRPVDGAVVWIEQRASLGVDPATGRPRATGFFADATERKEAESVAHANDEKYRLIVESARDYAILTTDIDGVIETWSPGAAAVFGWTAEEAIGQPIAITFTPEDRAARADAQERAIARRDGRAPDVRWHQRKDDTHVFIEGVMRVVYGGDGRPVGFLKVGRDQTARRRHERDLRELTDSLEQRVTERTREIARTNEALHDEIRLREHVERERRVTLRRLVTAEEDERRRLSRELHDQMGQQVTALSLGLATLAREVDEPEHQARIRLLEMLTADIATDIHDLALQLRPPALDLLGLPIALQNHLEVWSAHHGITADFHSAGIEGERLSSELEVAIYRISQEALTNVVRHAEAGRVSMLLERRAGLVTLIIEDDGRGFDAENAHTAEAGSNRMGLRGIGERVALLSGQVEIESAEGKGTTIYVRIPVEPRPARDVHDPIA